MPKEFNLLHISTRCQRSAITVLSVISSFKLPEEGEFTQQLSNVFDQVWLRNCLADS